jgi:protein transport protein SEC24
MAFPDFGSPSPTKPSQGKVPKGGLGQIMQSILGQGGSAGAGSPPPPQGPQGPAPMPQPGGMPQPPMMPGAPPMPGPGGPMQGAGMQPGISPEEHAAILEQIKGELMRSMAGQSGQQDQVFNASRGLASYRPMGNPSFPQLPPQGPQGPPMRPPTPPGPPQDAAFPPGMNPAGLDQWRQTGNPNPGMGLPMPPRDPRLR